MDYWNENVLTDLECVQLILSVFRRKCRRCKALPKIMEEAFCEKSRKYFRNA